MTTLRILVADGLALHRAALAAAFEVEPGVDVVGTAMNTTALLRKAAHLRPEVLLVDSGLPAAGGAAACATIKSRWPESRIVIVAPRPDQQLLHAAVQAGADGFITKEHAFSALVGAVRLVQHGAALVPTGPLGAALRRRTTPPAQGPTLTPRELDVLRLLVEGLDADRIAARLVIARNTARTHVQSILRKLHVHSRLEAVSLALELGLVELAAAS
jgi:DNA-binding NarL/FixJ family response regulator